MFDFFMIKLSKPLFILILYQTKQQLDKRYKEMYNFPMSRKTWSNISFEQKLDAVREYLKGTSSLRTIASQSKLDPKTLWRWVRLFQKERRAGLRESHESKRKITKEIELRVVNIKERHPAITINNARQIMNKEKVRISINGIWRIWKKYGIANRPSDDPLSPFNDSPTPEIKEEINKAKTLIKNNNHKAAARILNDLASMPKDDVLKVIPEELLSPRRRLELHYLNFGKIQFQQYARKARLIGQVLERQGHIYSSIIADFFELHALNSMSKSAKMLEVLDRLANKMYGFKERILWLPYYYMKATALSNLLRLAEALAAIEKYRRILYRYRRPHYWEEYGTLLTYVGKYKEACFFLRMAYEKNKDTYESNRLALKLAVFDYAMDGAYAKCRKILLKTRSLKDTIIHGASYSVTSAFLSFGQGNLHDASNFFLESLRKSTKGEFVNGMYRSLVGLATVAMALNRKADAWTHLQKCLALMKKCRVLPQQTFLKGLLGLKIAPILMPPVLLLKYIACANRTMRITDYRRAYRYARRQKMLGLFHRLILFFPETILHLLEKGKPTGLPKAILNLPVFNQKLPVYHIKFLGDLVVFKNQKYLKAKLQPKDTAFLIHLCTRVMEPGKSMNLAEIYDNLWPGSNTGARSFSHLMVRVKKALKMPTHFLTISKKQGVASLMNRGIFFMTDYQEFEQTLTQAKTLDRAGEWGFAKREYLRAFKLYRDEPFRKMYDRWSEDLRRWIVNQFETEAVNFSRSCLDHDNRGDAVRVLQKVHRLIPNSAKRTKSGEAVSDLETRN